MLVFQLKTHEVVVNCWSSLCFTLRRWNDTDNHKPPFILICHSFGLKCYLNTSFPSQMTRLILGCRWHMPSLPTGRKPHCFPPFPRGFPSALSADQVQLGTSSSSYLNLSQVAVGQFLLQPHRNAVSGTWFFSNCFLLLLPNLLTLQDRFGWHLFVSLLTVVL